MQKQAEAAAAAAVPYGDVPARTPTLAETPLTDVKPGLLRLAVQRADGRKGILALIVAKDATKCAWQLTSDPRHQGNRRATPLAALESWLAKYADTVTPFSQEQLQRVCHGSNVEAASEPPGQVQDEAGVEGQEEAEIEDLVETPSGVQIWSYRASLLNALRCPHNSPVAPLGSAAREDLEVLWRSQSHSPMREDSPMHEISAREEALMSQSESEYESESVMDKSDGLPQLSPESDTDALLQGHDGGVFEVDPMEDELPSGGQSGMMFVPGEDGEEGPESL